jgi:hypothetical protein
MTPKETAEELTLRYYKLGAHLYVPISFAKQCALIAVDEIRDNLPLISEIQQHWIEVKQEIKKL